MAVESYTQGHDDNTLASHRSRSAESQADYLLPHLKPSQHILDVGCGPATITCGLAKRVPQGSVIGVDYSEEALGHARREAESQQILNITFQAASAHELPFPDDHFDVVHCHAVLIHLPDAASAVREMRRVCKPGGYVAAREPDWESLVVHPNTTVLEQWKTAQMQLTRHEGAEPNAGRHLAQWAAQAGFSMSSIEVTCNVLEYSRDSLPDWARQWAKRFDGVLGQRAVRAGVVSDEDIPRIQEAFEALAREETGLWALMHMRLLARK